MKNTTLKIYRRLINQYKHLYLLDRVPDASAALALIKLKSSYSDPCLRVRRSSDNAENDFGFSGNTLDTASLLSFIGTNNAYITKWYDQSGNNNHAVQSSLVNQPQIVSNGSYLGHLYFDNADDVLTLPALNFSKLTAYMSLTTRNNNYYKYYLRKQDSFYIWQNSDNMQAVHWGSNSRTVNGMTFNNQNHQLCYRITGTQDCFKVNNITENCYNTTVAIPQNSNPVTISSIDNSSAPVNLRSLLMFNRAISDSELALIRSELT